MAFSTVVKDELARLWPATDCCARSELAGLVATVGDLAAAADGGLSLTLRSGHATVARKAYRLIQETLGVPAHISFGRRAKLDKSAFFTVRSAAPELGPALAAAGITDQRGEPLPPEPMETCCRRAYLRGAFLGAGFLADPRRGYHWEISTPDRDLARILRRALAADDIGAGLVRRRGEFVVYLKEAEGIGTWLSLAGAHQALLSLENTRIYKEMKNRVNRIVNCETANLSRTIDAGLRQQAAIKLIAATIGLTALPAPLQEVARLRLDHPEATLEELGRMMSPPLGKSGVNHRLRRLRRIAGRVGGAAPSP